MTPHLTQGIAAALAARDYEALPDDVRELARQCVLDTLGVAIAGASEPLVDILVGDAGEQGGTPACSLIGRPERAPLYAAALINGSMAHALDYDDVNMAMIGHPSAAILPGLLALAETRDASGRDLITAFVAGYEAACSIGAVMGAGQYAQGFHNTGTLGTFGAAGACARLLGLDSELAASALGIAGTQAAGLKVMFGSMCKPFHAGRASENGVRAALLAMRGFSSRADVLEARQGFAATHGPVVATNLPEVEFHIRRNLFKYHAACYNTHAAIEAVRALTGGAPLAAEAIEQVIVYAEPGLDKVCNIAAPRTGLEAKFSLRLTTAFALAGVDTARLDTFCDARTAEPRLVALRDKVSVEPLPGVESTVIEVEIIGRDGSRRRARHDAGVAATDIAEQGRRLRAKFLSLVEPVLGASAAQGLIATIANLDALPSVAVLARAAAGAAR